MFIKGNSLGKIAKYFTDKNIPTPSVYKNMNFNKDRMTRNLWDPRTIDDILKNPTYIGNLAQNRRRKVNYKSKKIIANSKDKWIIAENTHEPIIDKETFDIVQNIYSKTKNRNEKSHEYLLRGFLFCKECGHTLGINTSNDKYSDTADALRRDILAAINTFTDVVKGAYYEKAVLWAVEKGITTGTSATTFEPDSNCTRGQIVTFIYRSEK